MLRAFQAKVRLTGVGVVHTRELFKGCPDRRNDRVSFSKVYQMVNVCTLTRVRKCWNLAVKKPESDASRLWKHCSFSGYIFGYRSDVREVDGCVVLTCVRR